MNTIRLAIFVNKILTFYRLHTACLACNWLVHERHET